MYELVVVDDTGDEVFVEDYRSQREAMNAADDILTATVGFRASIFNSETSQTIANDNDGRGWVRI